MRIVEQNAVASGTSCSFTTMTTAAAAAVPATGRLLSNVCSLRSNVKTTEKRRNIKNGATDLLGTKILCIIPNFMRIQALNVSVAGYRERCEMETTRDIEPERRSDIKAVNSSK